MDSYYRCRSVACDELYLRTWSIDYLKDLSPAESLVTKQSYREDNRDKCEISFGSVFPFNTWSPRDKNKVRYHTVPAFNAWMEPHLR